MEVSELIKLLLSIPNQKQKIYLSQYDLKGNLALVVPHGLEYTEDKKLYIK